MRFQHISLYLVTWLWRQRDRSLRGRGEPPRPLSSRNICLLVSSWSRRWRRWRSWWRWWSLVTVGALHTTSCVWPKSPSAMITIMMRFEVWNKRWWWWLWRWWWYHLRAVRSLRAGPSLSPNPVVRWDSVRRGRQPPSILLSRNTCHMWIIRVLFGEMLTNFSAKIYFKVLKTGVHMQILTLALICPDNIYALFDAYADESSWW